MRALLGCLFAMFVSCAQAQVTPGTSPLSIAKGGTNASTASAARTSLGLAIGTNVEAWDTDLDCLAALGTAGVLQRTGTGTCAALTNTQLTALINLATASLPGAVPHFPNNTTTFLRGDLTYATLNFAALGGVATGAQLPTPGASSLGAVFSKSCASGGQFVQTINTDGTVNCVTPAGGGNVSSSGTPTSGQLAEWLNSTTIAGLNLGTGLAIVGGALQVNGNNAFGAPSFKVHLVTSQAVTANTNTRILFDTVDFDTSSGWSTGSHVYNPQVAGTYQICASMTASGTFTVGSTNIEMFISKNGVAGGAGTGIADYENTATNAAGGSSGGGCVYVSLNGSTDTIEADASIGGTSPNVQGVAAPNIRTYLTASRVGP